MSLAEQLTDYVHAAFSGLWVQTSEPDEAEREIAQLARARKWRLAVWDVAGGFRLVGAAPGSGGAPDAAGDPLAALRALPALAERGGTALLVAHNLHRFLSNPEVVQTAFAQLVAGKQQCTFIGSVERGERNLSILNLRKIARVRRVPLDELLDGLPR